MTPGLRTKGSPEFKKFARSVEDTMTNALKDSNVGGVKVTELRSGSIDASMDIMATSKDLTATSLASALTHALQNDPALSSMAVPGQIIQVTSKILYLFRLIA